MANPFLAGEQETLLRDDSDAEEGDDERAARVNKE